MGFQRWIISVVYCYRLIPIIFPAPMGSFAKAYGAQHTHIITEMLV